MNAGETHHYPRRSETERELGGPPMVDSNSAAPMAGEGYHRDRSDEAELAVAEARRDLTAARKEKPEKAAEEKR